MRNESKKNNRKDEKIRELLNRDKSMPGAPKNEWSKVHASIMNSNSSSSIKDKNPSSLLRLAKLWPALSGGFLTIVLIGLLAFPRMNSFNETKEQLRTEQAEVLLQYLFEDVGVEDNGEGEFILPGLASL